MPDIAPRFHSNGAPLGRRRIGHDAGPVPCCKDTDPSGRSLPKASRTYGAGHPEPDQCAQGIAWQDVSSGRGGDARPQAKALPQDGLEHEQYRDGPRCDNPLAFSSHVSVEGFLKTRAQATRKTAKSLRPVLAKDFLTTHRAPQYGSTQMLISRDRIDHASAQLTLDVRPIDSQILQRCL